MPAVRLIEPPRRVYNVSGVGQGNITIDSVVGTGLYFHEPFVAGDYFDYGFYNLSTNEAEVGWGIIENLASGLGVMSRNVDQSTDGLATALTLQAGQNYILFLKKSDARGLSEDPNSNKANRPEIITKTVNVLDWEELQDQTLATTATAQRFWVAQGANQDDGNAALWEWRPGSGAAGGDIDNDVTVTVIQSTAHPTAGRYHKVPISPTVISYADLANLPQWAIGFDGAGGDEVKFRHGVRGLMNVGMFTRYPKGVYDTIAQWKAVASTVWVEGDEILILGKTQLGDCAPFIIAWDDDNTNTTALDFTHYRPDDIAGANQGRAVRNEPAMTSKFTDSDATPSFIGSNEWKIADTPPAGGYTAFNNILEGETYYVWPPTTGSTILKTSIGTLPSTGDYQFRSVDGPLIVKKRGGTVIVGATHRGKAALRKLADATPIPTIYDGERVQMPDDGGPLDGVVGLNIGDSFQLVAGTADGTIRSGEDVSATSGAIAFEFTGDATKNILSTDKVVYTITRVANGLRISGGDGSNDVQVFDTLDDLRATPPSQLKSHIWVRGHTDADDGGGGPFYPTTDNLTGLDNDGTIIAHTADPTAGGARRDVSGAAAGLIFAVWFGVFALDATDYTSNMVNAVTHQKATEVTGEVHRELVLPAGVIETDADTFDLNEDYLAVSGDGRWLTTWECLSATGTLLNVGGADNASKTFRFSIRNIRFRQVSGTLHTAGQAVNIENTSRGVIENCMADGFFYGYRFANASHVLINDCRYLNTPRGTGNPAESGFLVDETSEGTNTNLKFYGIDGRNQLGAETGYNVCFHVKNCDGIFMTDSHFIGGDIGIRLEATATNPLTTVKLSNCYVDAMWEGSVIIDGSPNGSNTFYGDHSFTGCFFRAVSTGGGSPAGDGPGRGDMFVISPDGATNGGQFENIQIIGCNFKRAEAMLLLINNDNAPVVNVDVRACVFEEGNADDDNTYSYIRVKATSFTISGNTFRGGGGVTGYIIDVKNGSAEGEISNNNMIGAVNEGTVGDAIFDRPISILDQNYDEVMAYNNSVGVGILEDTWGQTRCLKERVVLNHTTTGSAIKIWSRQVSANQAITTKVFGTYHRTASTGHIGSTVKKFKALSYDGATGTVWDANLDEGSQVVKSTAGILVTLDQDGSNQNEMALTVTAPTASQTYRAAFDIMSLVSPDPAA